MTNKQSQSFKENYETLKRIADDLQRQEEPDIDELVPKVEEALNAYKQCKERIEIVRAKLEATLGEQVPNEQFKGAARDEPVLSEEDVDSVPF